MTSLIKSNVTLDDKNQQEKQPESNEEFQDSNSQGEDNGEEEDDNIDIIEKNGNHRKRNGQIEYLIKWLSYPNNASIWISKENICKKVNESCHKNKNVISYKRIQNYGNMTSNCIQVLMAMLILCLLNGKKCINVDPIYNLTKMSQNGIYKFPSYPPASCVETFHQPKKDFWIFTTKVSRHKATVCKLQMPVEWKTKNNEKTPLFLGSNSEFFTIVT